MKSWAEEFGCTWLADSDYVRAFDVWARHQFIANRGADELPDPQSAGVWSVNLLVRAVDEQGSQSNWPWVTLSIGVLAELLFCAEDGGTQPSRRTQADKDLRDNVERLRRLRNAMVHPAHQRDGGSGPPPVEELLRVTRHFDDNALQLPEFVSKGLELPCIEAIRLLRPANSRLRWPSVRRYARSRAASDSKRKAAAGIAPSLVEVGQPLRRQRT